MGCRSAKARGVYVARFPSEEVARVVYESIRPEAAATPTKRARVRVFLEGSLVKVEVVASDLTALRALTNSFLRFLACSYNTLAELGLLKKT